MVSFGERRTATGEEGVTGGGRGGEEVETLDKEGDRLRSPSFKVSTVLDLLNGGGAADGEEEAEEAEGGREGRKASGV